MWNARAHTSESAANEFRWPSDAAAKSAQWSLTNGIRLELLGQGTQVTGLHLGLADTDMSAGHEGEKVEPADVVRAALDGIEAGKIEVLVDEWSSHVKAALAADPREFYPQTVLAA